MHFGLLITYIAISLITLSKASITGYFGENDKVKFLEVLVKSLKVQPDDVSSGYFGAAGFKLLEKPIVEILKKENCAHLKANFKEDSPPETSFYALSTWQLLSCSGQLSTPKTINNLKAVLESDKSSTSEIRYALEALSLLGQQIPNPAKISQLLQARLKDDDSLQSIGHALHAATLLGTHGKFALERLEDIVSQADEVDGRLLQFEGGLTTTSLLLTGILKLPKNGKLVITQTQADKFASYLIARKTVQTPKGVLALLQVATALADSKVSPVAITVVGSPQVTNEKPNLKVRVSDLLGRPLKPVPSPIIAQSATRVADDVVVLSKQPLAPTSVPTEFSLALRLDPGQYRLGLSAGSHSSALTVRVLGPVALNWFEIGVGDVDGTTATRLSRLQHPAKLTSALQADSSNLLIAKISLSRNVHQVFLRLYNDKKEIIFVGEPDGGHTYKIEVNLANELVHSGTFQLELIIGDAVISNPIRWELGTLEAKLATPEAPKPQLRSPKPEIQHVFRQPEKRPADAISLFFTALAAAPLLLLLALWAKLGINVSNFSVGALPFHFWLGAIFGLFTLFWLKLDMFTTCAWLIPVGAFTFLSGQRLLSRMAAQKKPEK